MIRVRDIYTRFRRFDRQYEAVGFVCLSDLEGLGDDEPFSQDRNGLLRGRYVVLGVGRSRKEAAREMPEWARRVYGQQPKVRRKELVAQNDNQPQERMAA